MNRPKLDWWCPKCGWDTDHYYRYHGNDDSMTITCGRCSYQETGVATLDRLTLDVPAERDGFKEVQAIIAESLQITEEQLEQYRQSIPLPSLDEDEESWAKYLLKTNPELYFSTREFCVKCDKRITSSREKVVRLCDSCHNSGKVFIQPKPKGPYE